MLPRCPSFDGSFVRQFDTLCLPGLETLPLHRVCFDPAAFSPECFGAQGIILPASLQGAAPKRLGEFLARIKGRIRHQALERVSPLSVPILLEIGREQVFGAHEEVLRSAAHVLIKEATEPWT